MSRIGKIPIPILEKVKAEIDKDLFSVEGPKGKLSQKIPSSISVAIEDGNVIVRRKSDTKRDKSLHGLMRAIIFNMIKGVSEGYTRELEIVGVGFRAQLEGKNLVMQLGFSHPVKYTAPEEINIEVIKQTRIVVRGIDKAKVGQVASEIRRIKPPEPYKGTGIKYAGEQIRKKLGKAAGTK